ncbi:fascin domain-containing protein [Streptosporangium subroseum]|uniref:fascin domain-containing protein n=1 Tax=Streptosporangium subroseum TaxID=106412 RepID=UPI003085F91D|nr:hypothetical protein OHB15_16245 [Streptosporangium subroseum]
MSALTAPGALASRAATAGLSAPAGWALVKGGNSTSPSTLIPGVYPLRFLAEGYYAVAELGYAYPGNDKGMLRTRSMTIGPWEQFYFIWDSGTSSWLLFSIGASSYVTTELGYAYPGNDRGMLRARSTAIGPWEQFELLFSSGSGTYALRSKANGMYVTTELGYAYPGNDRGMLRARSTTIGPWEQFQLN